MQHRRRTPQRLKQPHRLLYFFVAFVLLMFFGLIYAWSLFVDPLEAEFGWDRSATSVVFTLSIITFCAGMLVAGALEERTSPRTVMLITAACLGLGLIASAFTESLPFIYATYGVLVGAGVGLGTDVVMSVTLKWFPDKQGLASGAMLMGFGGGTMLLSPVVTTMLGALGWRHDLRRAGGRFRRAGGGRRLHHEAADAGVCSPSSRERRGRTPPWRPST